jgi:hypothetical protein
MAHTFRLCFALTALAATAVVYVNPTFAAPRNAPAGIVTAHDPIVLAQGGSTGGSIGKSDKSIGGESSPPPSSPAPRESRPVRRETPPPPSRRGGGGGGNYDGAWAVISVGCGGSSTSAVIITSGRVVGEGLTGSVSGGGSGSTLRVMTCRITLCWARRWALSSLSVPGRFFFGMIDDENIDGQFFRLQLQPELFLKSK